MTNPPTLHASLASAIVTTGDDRADGFAETLAVLRYAVTVLAKDEADELPNLRLAFHSASSSIAQLLRLVSTTCNVLEHIETAILPWQAAFLRDQMLDTRTNFAKLKIAFAAVVAAEPRDPDHVALLGERAMRVGRLVLTLWNSMKGSVAAFLEHATNPSKVEAPAGNQSLSGILKGASALAESCLETLSSSTPNTTHHIHIILNSSNLVALLDRASRAMGDSAEDGGMHDEGKFLLDLSVQEVANCTVAAVVVDSEEAVELMRKSLVAVVEVVDEVKSSVRSGNVVKSRIIRPVDAVLEDIVDREDEAIVSTEAEPVALEPSVHLLSATVPELVSRITHWDSRIYDDELRSVVLRVWSSFLTAQQLLTAMTDHFHKFVAVPDHPAIDVEVYIIQVMEPTRKSILSFLIEWVLSDHGFIMRDNLQAQLLEFTSLCLDILIEIPELELVKRLASVAATPMHFAERLASLNISDDSEKQTPITSLLHVSAQAIANQLTLIDFEIYKRISASELLESDKRKPNLTAFQHRFNFIVGLVSTLVINCESPKERALMIVHFIQVAKICYNTKSLNSGLAIISALTSASLFRLTHTWPKVPPSSITDLDHLKKVFSYQSNWSALRSVISSTPKTTPCVPHLGFLAHDLIFIQQSQDKWVGGGKVNLTRCRQLQRVVDSAFKFQGAVCTIVRDPALREYLQLEKGLYITQSAQFAASIAVEARGMR
ncbi:hypothetical protein HDU98_004057 [Podochytrium sp. JEL0797]|nr:hypothetical protein HDU98_004057 [Podochytrium sp. JEL0797]